MQKAFKRFTEVWSQGHKTKADGKHERTKRKTNNFDEGLLRLPEKFLLSSLKLGQNTLDRKLSIRSVW